MDMTIAAWRKSSYSGTNGGNCVEVAHALSDVLVVRDSKDPDGGRLTVSPRAWEMLARRIKNAESGLI